MRLLSNLRVKGKPTVLPDRAIRGQSHYFIYRPCTPLISDGWSEVKEVLNLCQLRCCVTNRKVAGSIPAGVSGFFFDIKSFRSHYGPGVDPASNRNEYQEYFLGVKTAGA